MKTIERVFDFGLKHSPDWGKILAAIVWFLGFAYSMHVSGQNGHEFVGALIWEVTLSTISAMIVLICTAGIDWFWRKVLKPLNQVRKAQIETLAD